MTEYEATTPLFTPAGSEQKLRVDHRNVGGLGGSEAQEPREFR